MDILASRILLRPADPARAQTFYRDVLGLAVYREFGPPDSPGIVFFLGQGFLEVSGHGPSDAGPAGPGAGPTLQLWLQVRDVHAEHVRLKAAGVVITRPPRQEPWGLLEMWLTDPEGVPIVLVEIPADHPLRRDTRT